VPRRVVVPAQAALDESGHAYLVRSSTMRDRPALMQLRTAAEAIGGANSYFGRASLAPQGDRPVHKTWPTGGTTIVAESGGSLLGAARFARLGTSTDATVVVAVGDVLGPSDIGRHLVAVLAGAAHDAGVEHFVADLLTTNAAMLAMFVSAGFATEIGVGDGVMHMIFSVDPRERSTGRSNVRAIPMWESASSGHRSDPGASGMGSTPTR
jgi:hypothetical protein